MKYGNWTLGIGDPTPMGWLTVVAYVAASVLCLICSLRSVNTDGKNRARLVWAIIAAAMLLLGINKQLDLQSLFTEIGRQIAKSQGWYEDRRRVQSLAIAIFGICGAAGLLAVGYYARTFFRKFWLAFAGIAFLAVFIIIRAASFHHVDEALRGEISGWRLNWILELGGIACIILCALRNLLQGTAAGEIPKRDIPDL